MATMSEGSSEYFVENLQPSLNSPPVPDVSGEASSDEGRDGVDYADVFTYFVNIDRDDDLFSKDVVDWTPEYVVGKCFVSVSAAEGFYRFYSKKMGFGFRRNNQERDRQSGLITMKRWVCSREGLRDQRRKTTDDPKREPRPITRCCCQAAFIIRRMEVDGVYRVTQFRTIHNHELANPQLVHFFRCNRGITTGHAMEIRTMKESGIKTCQIMDFMVTSLGGFHNVGFIAKDLYNFISIDNERTRRLCTDAEATLAYFNALVETDPGLFVKYSVSEENRLHKIFWSDSRSRLDYANFGDVLVIDSTYKTNYFKMPLVEFVGINNHRSIVVFASALVNDETVDSYVWTFTCFLQAMEGQHPVSVITDGDKAIAAALTKVMPSSRHKLCSWHLMRNARVISHDASFLSDFRKCMMRAQSEDSFEESWQHFQNKYSHVNRQWLEEMYEKKDKWAEAFFRGIFFGWMTTNQRCESTNAYMNRFLNSDLSLYKFVKQYSRAMGRLRENVMRNDFTNQQSEMTPQTHLQSLERSAASFYARAVFVKVREEISKESSYTPIAMSSAGHQKKYVLKKFGVESAGSTIVAFNVEDSTWICDCGHFESVRWPCRHMFCGMKAMNMEEIPKSMLFTRWAKLLPATFPVLTNKITTTTMELRYGSLISKAHQLCHLASSSDERYRHIMSVMESKILEMPLDVSESTSGSENPRKQKRDNTYVIHIVRDPEIVRTKGTQPDKKGDKGTRRRCGWCKETGHYISSCPNLISKSGKNREGNLGGIGSQSWSDSFEEEIFL